MKTTSSEHVVYTTCYEWLVNPRISAFDKDLFTCTDSAPIGLPIKIFTHTKKHKNFIRFNFLESFWTYLLKNRSSCIDVSKEEKTTFYLLPVFLLGFRGFE